MAAITACSGIFPKFHIDMDKIKNQEASSMGVKSKSVPANDDDAVSLGIEAGNLNDIDSKNIGALWFASTSQPYNYGEVGAMIIEALGLSPSTCTATVSGSARAGTIALWSALNHVDAHGESALVITSEAPDTNSQWVKNKIVGSGAASILIEPTSNMGLVKVSTGSYSKPLLEVWQAPGDVYNKSDKRFARDVGYVDTITKAVQQALNGLKWDLDNLDALILSQPNPKLPDKVRSSLGVEEKTLLGSDITRNFGDLQSAGPFITMSNCTLEGEKVIMVGYGSGCADAIAFNLETKPKSRSVNADNSTKLSFSEYLERMGSK